MRYVVLHHEGHGPAHFDLMIDVDGTSLLRSWRLRRWPAVPGDVAERIAGHRREYLTYQGPVSGDRGVVSRVASGSARWQHNLAMLDCGIAIDLKRRALDIGESVTRLVLPTTGETMSLLKPALQLWSIRDMTAWDFAGAVKQVADIGYEAVELAGYGSAGTAQGVKDALDAAGLKAVSSHVALNLLTDNLAGVIQDAQVLGLKDVVCPATPPDARNSTEAWTRTARTLDEIGNKLNAVGLAFGYHNHAWEYEQHDGRTGLDILFANSDPKNVKFQPDCFWNTIGGEDPVQAIEKRKNRIISVHLKELSSEGKDVGVAPGDGTIDFKAFANAAKSAGVEWGIVEQEGKSETPKIELVRRGYDNLKAMGVY